MKGLTEIVLNKIFKKSEKEEKLGFGFLSYFITALVEILGFSLLMHLAQT
jgi:hypothetical protein